MGNSWNALRAKSRPYLVLYFSILGAFSGLVSWVAIMVAHMLFDVVKPSGMSLLLAIPLGTFFGVILALILFACWNKRTSRDE
jgi:ABC-type Fe3+-siderophore transport system permease subunit